MGGETSVRVGGRGTITLAIVAFLGVCGFIGREVWTMKAEVAALKEDQSQWGSLAELKQEQINQKIELEVTLRVLEYHFGKRIPRARSSPSEPEAGAEPPPIGLPPVQRVNPEEYRNVQQQKYGTKK